MLSPKHTLMVVSLLDMLSVGLFMPQLPHHIRSFGGSHIVIGVMGALYSAGQLISGPLIGSLSDLKGRKPILLLCLSICGLSYLLLGFVSSVFIFIIIRVIVGLTKQTQLLVKTLGPDYVIEKGEQSILYGRMASVSSMGMSIGPIIGGHIMEAFPDKGFTLITITMAAIVAVNLSLIWSLPELKKKKQDKRKDSSKGINLINSISTPLKESIEEFYKIDWTIFGDVFLFKLLMTFCMTMYFGNFVLFLKTVHNVQPKNLGYIISFQSVTASLCSYFIGHINKLYKNDADFTLRNFHVFLIVTMTLVCFSLVSSLSVIIVLLMPLAIATSIGRIVILEMITERSKSENRGKIIGATNSVKYFCGVFTPLIDGIINQYLGISYIFLMAAIFTGIASVVSYRLRMKSLKVKDK